MRYDAPAAFTHSFEINANPGLTPPSPEGPLAPPGVYTLKLTVDGRSYTQHVTVRNDPRSPATLAALRAQHDLQMKFYDGARATWDGFNQAAAMRRALAPYLHASGPSSEVVSAATALDAKLAALAGSTERGRGGFGGGAVPAPSFVALNGRMTGELTALDYGDMAPTGAMRAAYAAACSDMSGALATWKTINTQDVVALNALLVKDNQKPIAASVSGVAVPSCGAIAKPAIGRRTP
ncbi:MAG TPA: hypothetical protein VGT98_07920, partial [Candidatus Elarobacter sp.]|nr:hypothetical protein [Candidatus Elarobacter sp.]